MKNKTILLVSGKYRSGKDTTAKMLKKIDNSIKIVSFASPLKQIIADTFDIPAYELDEWKNENRRLIHGVPENGLEDMTFNYQTYRSVLQRFGTDAMHKAFGINVWSDFAIKTSLSYFRFCDIIVMPDWRFPTEYTYLKEQLPGIRVMTCRIDRPNIEGNDHVSEISLDDHDFDFIINNDSDEFTLYKKVEELYANITAI